MSKNRINIKFMKNNILEFISSGEKEQWIPFELDTENTISLK